MPLTNQGLYFEQYGERGYEAESLYYLNYYIISALICISKIDNCELIDGFENEIQYYHFYTDHLLFSIGQISSRFIINEKTDSKLLKERKTINRQNFMFLEKDFPIISDRKPRNVVEHIGEKNIKIIEKKYGVAGFNVINSTISEELANALRKHTFIYNYTLDLICREIIIVEKDEIIKTDIDELKAELLKLQDNIKRFKDISEL